MITAPVEMLREINIVDTPGTNAVRREHEALTREFVPRSDLVLFITSADRPFTESERAFLQSIREWGKKVDRGREQDGHPGDRGRRAAGRRPSSPRTSRRCWAPRPRSSRSRPGSPCAPRPARRTTTPWRGAASSRSRPTWRARWTRRSASGSSCSTRSGWACACWTSTWSGRRRAWSCCARTSRRSRTSTASSTLYQRGPRARLPLPPGRRGEGAAGVRAAGHGVLRRDAAPGPRVRPGQPGQAQARPSSGTWWPTCRKLVEKRVEEVIDWMVAERPAPVAGRDGAPGAPPRRTTRTGWWAA